jgi:hypothetical protein
VVDAGSFSPHPKVNWQNPFRLQIWPWARNTKNYCCQLRFFKTFLAKRWTHPKVNLQNPFCLQIWPWARNTKNNYCYSRQLRFFKTFLGSDSAIGVVKVNLFALTLLWLVLIKINTVSANFNNTGPYSRQLRFFKMFFGNDIEVQTVNFVIYLISTRV